MLESLVINSIDSISVIYLWTCLTKNNNNLYKLFFSIISSSIILTVNEHFNLTFLISYIAIITLLVVIYKEGLKNTVLVFLLVLFVDIILQLMFSLIIGRFINAYTTQGMIVESLILIIIIIFSKTKFLRNKISFDNIENNILIYLISIFCVYVIVFKFICEYDSRIILNNTYMTIIIVGILFISQILIYLYLTKVIKEKEKLKLSSEYNNIIDEIVEEIKRRQHDFANYKNTIRGIVEVLDEKEIKQAITNYVKDEDTYDNNINELIYIENVVIKSIIYRSVCKAKKYHINFHYEIENYVLDDILNYQETSNLLSNLLNNAFDEVLKNECNEKNIDIKIFSEINKSHIVIKNQVVNSEDINLNKIFKKGYSTKSNDTRGYGLYNVQEIVNLHKGYIKIRVEDDEIIFDIYFDNI
ncbi:ATP-binding protein [Clostridium weizhouense]|uniref:GHKL domain-containing protein n=1 Tax=Clostridium weizhouense TaxID=2859781 RepID=A0ABS7AQ56_9CLOT|nr:GHKL domain-containing protein [Clostridium weizhouense]MBW6410757.1 GHKL domain-containing protein [Clostridium weizhouense]